MATTHNYILLGDKSFLYQTKFCHNGHSLPEKSSF